MFTTGDAQVTLIFPEGSFASAAGQRSVKVTVEPLPSSIAHPDDPLTVVGNVYLIEATYEPSGDDAALARVATVVLVYPLLANDHGSHSMIWSRSGNTWSALDTDDLPSIQQAGADIDELGYLSVAGQPPSPTAGAGTGDGGLRRDGRDRGRVDRARRRRGVAVAERIHEGLARARRSPSGAPGAPLADLREERERVHGGTSVPRVDDRSSRTGSPASRSASRSGATRSGCAASRCPRSHRRSRSPFRPRPAR